MQTFKRVSADKVKLGKELYIRATEHLTSYREFITVEGINYYPASKKKQKAVQMELAS